MQFVEMNAKAQQTVIKEIRPCTVWTLIIAGKVVIRTPVLFIKQLLITGFMGFPHLPQFWTLAKSVYEPGYISEECRLL
jgi:hypothetical protein